MKKCKCISNNIFVELGNQDYNVFVGNDYLYHDDKSSDVIKLCSLEEVVIIYLFRKIFYSHFIDLYKERQRKIKSIL